jgi:hypothetical protein
MLLHNASFFTAGLNTLMIHLSIFQISEYL